MYRRKLDHERFCHMLEIVSVISHSTWDLTSPSLVGPFQEGTRLIAKYVLNRYWGTNSGGGCTDEAAESYMAMSRSEFMEWVVHCAPSLHLCLRGSFPLELPCFATFPLSLLASPRMRVDARLSSFSKQHLIIYFLGLNVFINLHHTPNVKCWWVFIALFATDFVQWRILLKKPILKGNTFLPPSVNMPSALVDPFPAQVLCLA